MTRIWLSLCVLLNAAAAVEGGMESFLLATTPFEEDRTCSGSGCGAVPTNIRFFLTWTDNAGGFEVLGETDAPLWPFDGHTPGSFEFTPLATANFADFVARITDGVNNFLGRSFRLSNGISSTAFATESFSLGTTTDLVGNEIDSIILFVDELTLTPHAPGYDFSAVGRWEFWGIPEPGTLAMLAFGSLLTAMRRWRR